MEQTPTHGANLGASRAEKSINSPKREGTFAEDPVLNSLSIFTLPPSEFFPGSLAAYVSAISNSPLSMSYGVAPPMLRAITNASSEI
jgi:hypothetical protein